MEQRIKLYAGNVCPRRSLDLVKLENYFRLNGCEIVKDAEQATDIIFVSCGFVERNIREAIDTIDLLKSYPGRLIVGGCLFDIDKQRFLEHHNKDDFTTKNMSKIDNLFSDFKVSFDSIPDANTRHNWRDIGNLLGQQNEDFISEIFNNPYVHNENEMWSLRIGYGCNSKCTYCSHRSAIGEYRDKPVDECLEEFKKGYNKGERKFLITSMNTGYYGYNERIPLPRLLEKFLEIHSDVQFFVEGINPMWISRYAENYEKLIKNNNIIQILSPIQSGSPAILEKMKRKYDFEKIKNFFRFFKDENEKNILISEIIIGFPSETEDDLYQTLNFTKDSKMDFLYIYPYYENQFMESKNIYPKCEPHIIKKRLDLTISFFRENKIGFQLYGQ